MKEEREMNRAINLPVVFSAVLFTLFVTNVIIGSLKMTPFLSDVGEALTLFFSCVIFVIGILKLEKSNK